MSMNYRYLLISTMLGLCNKTSTVFRHFASLCLDDSPWSVGCQRTWGISLSYINKMYEKLKFLIIL